MRVKIYLSVICCLAVMFMGSTAWGADQKKSSDTGNTGSTETPAAKASSPLEDFAKKGLSESVKSLEGENEQFKKFIDFLGDGDIKKNLSGQYDEIKDFIGKANDYLKNNDKKDDIIAVLKKLKKKDVKDEEIPSELDSSIADYKKKLKGVKNEKSGSANVGYDTNYFLLNTGAVLLSPYTLRKDTNQTNIWILENKGQAATTYFIEGYFKKRAVWLGKMDNCVPRGDQYKFIPRCVDLDFRAGFASADKDASGATVAGNGDMYSEITLGIPGPFELNNSYTNARLSANVEFLQGFVTDHAVQAIHTYDGIGLAIIYSVPLFSVKENGNDKQRYLEGLLGVYSGHTSAPRILDDSYSQTNVLVKGKSGYPVFRNYLSKIYRMELHIPIFETGYVVISGRMHMLKDHNNSFNPWSVSVGYTVPPEILFDSIKKIIVH